PKSSTRSLGFTSISGQRRLEDGYMVPLHLVAATGLGPFVKFGLQLLFSIHAHISIVNRLHMFERYTEDARRVIFYGRYEASQFSSLYIETEHLLLAISREQPFLLRSLLPHFPYAAQLRSEIEA